MKTQLIIFLLALVVCKGQDIVLTVNDDVVSDRSRYNYMVNYMQLAITDKSLPYKIHSGKISWYQNFRSPYHTLTLNPADTGFISGMVTMPGDRVYIQVDSITNTKTGKVTRLHKDLIFTVAKNAAYKQNPYLDLLINNNIDYKVSGIKMDQVKSFEIRSLRGYHADSVEILFARGKRLLSGFIYTRMLSAGDLQGKHDIYKGDRIILTSLKKIKGMQPMWVILIL